MSVVLLIIAVNSVVSLLAAQAFRSPDRLRQEQFLFSPTRVARGEGYLAALLSCYSHGSIAHFAFNMITFFFFAPVVASHGGAFGLLLAYLISDAVALATTYAVQRNNSSWRSLGASGAVSGVLFAAIVARPEMNLFLFFIPIPIPGPLFAVAWLVISFILMRRGSTGISHEAHLGGAVAGSLFAAIWMPGGLGPLLRWLF